MRTHAGAAIRPLVAVISDMQPLIDQVQAALGGNAGLALGYGLIGVLSCQLVLMAWSTLTSLWHERAQQRLDLERLETLVKAAKYRYKEAQEVVQGWNGYRKFTVTQKSS